MVFESLINPFRAERRPLALFFIGFIYTIISVFLALWIFEDYASLVMVFLVTMFVIPLFYHTMLYEEERLCHKRAIIFFIFMFIGFVFGFVSLYLILPQTTLTNLFKIQFETISTLNQEILAQISSQNLTLRILLNNVKVFSFSILFSFLFGSGAIFILVWNASVLAAAVGAFIKTQLISFPAPGGFLIASGLSFLRYGLHGIPEVTAYFIGGLAGGILSALIIRKDWHRSEKVILSAGTLIFVALALLVIAAIIEVYLVPNLFKFG